MAKAPHRPAPCMGALPGRCKQSLLLPLPPPLLLPAPGAPESKAHSSSAEAADPGSTAHSAGPTVYNQWGKGWDLRVAGTAQALEGP
eukprot:1157532-Pelagomonas_calceolata.AAC.7